MPKTLETLTETAAELAAGLDNSADSLSMIARDMIRMIADPDPNVLESLASTVGSLAYGVDQLARDLEDARDHGAALAGLIEAIRDHARGLISARELYDHAERIEA